MSLFSLYSYLLSVIIFLLNLVGMGIGVLKEDGHRKTLPLIDSNTMKYIVQKSLVYVLSVTALLFGTTDSAPGIILHPDGEPNLATWIDRPSDDVVGRWGNIASCVVVSSNCVITTKHQAYNTSTFVEIGGKRYDISNVWDHNTADLRIAKLHGANLPNFVDIYEATNELREAIVIGGYGDSRGDLLQTQGITYGYSWDGSSNTTLRFGTNRIQYIENDSNNFGLISDVIAADFTGLNDRRPTSYECIAADHDSGCGWFIKVGDTWQVAGLSRTVQAHYEIGHENDPNYVIYEQSWFRDSNDPNISAPDRFDAIRLSSYARWIYDTLPPVLAGDLNGDDHVDFYDFAVFVQLWLNSDCHIPDWCLGADFELDGDVDWSDLAEFAYLWLQHEPTL
jgi:hypothetical protein